eukprot:CAMPEP_0196810682 /NCGR_PEP_ID=MMETSP1362-20130617/13234_1 /TAXON_ID=163516 /ORGANISM="Leptocylindrus danicus, Strain CCMP1856" /LENGTH=116 /DNA_ID=CAMNT_0042185787 /DNA_START=70 /DNA_END=420 /DNA_ORIENTATION=+
MTLAQSFNTARRLSNRVEPDLVQESYSEVYTKEKCDLLLKKMVNLSSLPVECQQYAASSKSKSEQEGVDPFAGMYSGQKAAAVHARKTGRPTHAVLERRFTKVRGSTGAKAASSNH